MELKGRILIYTIDGCKHCKAAKSILKKCNLPYSEVNLDDFPDRRYLLMHRFMFVVYFNFPYTTHIKIYFLSQSVFRKEMAERTNRKTVPQIFFNAKHIGGNSELEDLVSVWYQP